MITTTKQTTETPIQQKKFPKNFILIALILSFLSIWVYKTYIQWIKAERLQELVNDDEIWEEIKDLKFPDGDLFEKMTTEIKGLKSKPRHGYPCKQYILTARVAGVYRCEHQGTILLNTGEIWKIGKTCMNKEDRYKSGFPDRRLRMLEEFSGTALQCLIVEKIKIYAYFYYPENQQRTNPLHLPPGNKIYR